MPVPRTLFRGGAGETFEATSDLVIEVEAETDFTSLGPCGDLNGHDPADVAAADVPPASMPAAGRIAIFTGSETAYLEPAVVRTGAAYPFLGWNIAAGCDLNGDGLADLIVGAPAFGEVQIFFGRADIVVGPEPDFVLPAPLAGITFPWGLD